MKKKERGAVNGFISKSAWTEPVYHQVFTLCMNHI